MKNGLGGIDILKLVIIQALSHFIRAEKGRHDIHTELNTARAAIDQVAREKVDYLADLSCARRFVHV